jgi:hypothetical protein
MKAWKFAAVLMIVFGLIATSSHATESVAGRWAADVSSCEGFAGLGALPLVVSNYAVRW